jgi:hypothetical protein
VRSTESGRHTPHRRGGATPTGKTPGHSIHAPSTRPYRRNHDCRRRDDHNSGPCASHRGTVRVRTEGRSWLVPGDDLANGNLGRTVNPWPRIACACDRGVARSPWTLGFGKMTALRGLTSCRQSLCASGAKRCHTSQPVGLGKRDERHHRPVSVVTGTPTSHPSRSSPRTVDLYADDSISDARRVADPHGVNLARWCTLCGRVLHARNGTFATRSRKRRARIMRRLLLRPHAPRAVVPGHFRSERYRMGLEPVQARVRNARKRHVCAYCKARHAMASILSTW